MGRELLSPLFKDEMQRWEKGERLGRKTLSLPLFNADENCLGMVDHYHALIDEMSPGQIGRCLGMAHHYLALGVRIRAHPHVGDSPLPQAIPRRIQR